MSFTYTRDIPDPPSSPSVDVPKMKINTNSIDNIWAVDHFTFDSNLAGKHQFVRMPNTTIPPGMAAGQGAVYIKTASGNSQLFYTNGASGNEYQLTRANNPNFSTFGENIAYGTPPVGFTQIGGWSFLPGGLLFQYGFYGLIGATQTSGTVQFPFTFTSAPYSVNFSLLSNKATFADFQIFSVSTSSFAFRCSLADRDGFYWQAIGN